MQDTVLDAIPTGVYILTAQHQGKMNGSTVAWVTPVSYDPLLVLVSLATLRVSHDLVKLSGYFVINTLGKDKVETARHFGFKTARDTDKMQGVGYSTSEHGLPVLDDACAYVECRLVDTCPAGEHTLFIGEVVAAKIVHPDVEPLIFKQEDYF